MEPTGKPFVSILTPSRNEEKYISRCLDAIFHQDYPHDRMEILIADGMSQDGTRKIIQTYQGKDIPITLVDNPGLIVPTGLNAAIRKSRGDIIIRVDGHTEIAPDYVRQCVSTLQRSKADNVGGRMNAVGESSFGKAVSIATSSPFGVGGARFHYSSKEEWVDTVYMGAWPREVFSKIGLFDEEMVRDQDDEFNYRLLKAGGKILLNPKIMSQYSNRGSPRSLWKQYYQYGFWKVRVLQKHPAQMRGRQFIPPLFVLSLILTTLTTLFTDWGGWLLLIVAGSYLLTNLTASILTAAQKGWRHAFLLPITYLIIHMGYGAGLLVGLIVFWNRWAERNDRIKK